MRVENKDAILSWGWDKPPSSTGPVNTSLSLETDDGTLRVDIDLTSDMVSHLLSGTVVHVNAKVKQSKPFAPRDLSPRDKSMADFVVTPSPEDIRAKREQER